MLSNTISSYYNNIHNINYDCEFVCTYKLHDDDDDRNLCYQLQLLQALKISSYDNTILTSHIEKISYFLQNNSEINAVILLLKEKYKTTNIAFMIDDNNTNALFQLLFSYEYFDIFHKCISNYIHDRKDDRKDDTDLDLSRPYFDELKKLISL